MKDCEVTQEDVQASDCTLQAVETLATTDQTRELSVDEVEFAFGHAMWGS